MACGQIGGEEVMTDNSIAITVRQLITYPREEEWFEFKEN